MRIDPLPDGLRLLAPAKLNLYLEIGPRRPDGFHDIDSVFHAIALHDELELRRAPEGIVELEEEGIQEAEKNLVLRAARRLLASPLLRPGCSPGARLRLRKRIPEGAGLGGGSSDAAAALVGLSRLWELDASTADLLPLAAALGSDVAFFLHGGTARCRGRGEVVEPWPGAFADRWPLWFVLAYPRLKVPTAAAYAALDSVRGPDFTLTAPSPIDSMPPATVQRELGCGNLLYNRFEQVVYAAYPALQGLHARLCEEPFLKVLLSGSGSTVYGLARDGGEAHRIAERLRARIAADVYVAQSDPSGG
jgi:4-diphosphocytidyl-2-C-methyl-D-erythritol kinase